MFNCCGCPGKKGTRTNSEDEYEEKEKEVPDDTSAPIEAIAENKPVVLEQEVPPKDKPCDRETKVEIKIEETPESVQDAVPDSLGDASLRKSSLKKPKPRLSISTEVKIIPNNFDDEQNVVVAESPQVRPDGRESPLSDEVFAGVGTAPPRANLGVSPGALDRSGGVEFPRSPQLAERSVASLEAPLASPRGKVPTPHPVKRGSMPAVLPHWLSEDDDGDEGGGVQEPPVTPVAKDELALRRHRFFADLLSAAQAAAEHRVSFDPFGPEIAKDSDNAQQASELEALLERLENITARLERTVPILEEKLEPLTKGIVVTKSLEDLLDEHLTPTERKKINSLVSDKIIISPDSSADFDDLSERINDFVLIEEKLARNAEECKILEDELLKEDDDLPLPPDSITEETFLEEEEELTEDFVKVLTEEIVEELLEDTGKPLVEETIEEPLENLQKELKEPLENLEEELEEPLENLQEALEEPLENLREDLKESLEKLQEELNEPLENLQERLEEHIENLQDLNESLREQAAEQVHFLKEPEVENGYLSDRESSDRGERSSESPDTVVCDIPVPNGDLELPQLPVQRIQAEMTNSQSTLSMSVQGFQGILQGPFATYLQLSKQIGGDVAEHAKLAEKAFQAQLQYLLIAQQCKKPHQSEEQSLLQPTSQCIQAIQEFREKHRSSPLFNHLSAISESIPALGWVTVSPTPSPFVKEMNDAGQFYTNRVLKDWKEKDKTHVEWTKAWVQTLSELQGFVKQHHTTGLVWSGTGSVPSRGGPPPPPSGPLPPPPPPLDLNVGDLDIGGANDRSALFAEINRGTDVTRGLKKVTSDMQTHKNPTLRSGPAPFKAASGGQATRSVAPAAAPIDKPPVFARDGKKWLVEYQKGNHNLVIEGAEMNNVVYVFRCQQSTITVKGKVNSIFLDSCKSTAIVFDSVVSGVEFVNCQSVQMQVFGAVNTICIDKTDGCQMYLSDSSLNVEIISSKSSEMNVLVPKGNGDFTEFPVPEQFRTTVSKKGLTTVASESTG